MAGRRDEIYAAVDSGVWDSFLSVDVDLLLQVRLVLVINEFHNRLPARAQQEMIWRILRQEGGER